jgi:RNA polymerase sigma-70 factor (ECF subfamily)
MRARRPPAVDDLPPETLVQRISAGDTNAEAELIQRFSRPLLTMLEMRTGDRQRAEDVHQETFCIVLERLRSTGLDDPRRISAFLHRTAINVLIGEYRKDVRRRTETDTDLIERFGDSETDQLRALIRQESDQAVRAALQDLTNPRDKEVLYRFYILQEEKAAICAALKLSTAHFDRVISRARKRFRHFIEIRRPSLVPLEEMT